MFAWSVHLLGCVVSFADQGGEPCGAQKRHPHLVRICIPQPARAERHETGGHALASPGGMPGLHLVVISYTPPPQQSHLEGVYVGHSPVGGNALGWALGFEDLGSGQVAWGTLA